MHQVSCYALMGGWIDHTRTRLRKLKIKNNAADVWVCWCNRIIPFSNRIFGQMLPVTLTHSLQQLRAQSYNTGEKDCRSKMPSNDVKEVISDVSVLTTERKFAVWHASREGITAVQKQRKKGENCLINFHSMRD